MSRYNNLSNWFIPFVMLGDPDIAKSEAIIDELIAGGADALELGIPFSDPVADGPVIQRAAMRALTAGVTPTNCLALLTRIRAKHPKIAIGILTYANLVVHDGIETFYQKMAKAGVDSVLIADVPTFEIKPFAEAAIKQGIAPVMIAPPNASDAQLETIAKLGKCYTYVVTRAGVTGADKTLHLNAESLLQKLKKLGAPPAVFGFGISTPEHVKQAIEAGAAGVISGSAIVCRVEQGSPVEDFVREMKAATRRKN